MAEILDPNENKIKMTPRPHVKLEVACLTSLPPVRKGHDILRLIKTLINDVEHNTARDSQKS